MKTITTEADRQKVLDAMKPKGRFQSPPERAPFGKPTLPWTERLGDLNTYRNNKGKERWVAPLVGTGGKVDQAKTQSICNSIKTQLNKDHPGESWAAVARPDGIYVRFNGDKRVVQRANREKTQVSREPESSEGASSLVETG